MEEHVGSVERRALLADAPSADLDLDAVLSRYARTIEASNAAISLPVGRRKRSS